MNWWVNRRADLVSIGAWLALLIVAASPNFGLKFGMSPTLPSVLLAFIGIWLVMRERLALFESRAQRRWLLILLLLCVPMVISIPQSYDQRLSMSIAGASLLYAFTGIALIRVLQGEPARQWLATGIALVLAFWSVDSIIQYFAGRDLFGVTLTPDQRVPGPFEGNFRQATLLAILLPVALGVLARRRHGAWLATAFFLLASLVAMLAGVRMIIIMLGLVVAGMYLHLPRSRWKVFGLLGLLTVSVIATLLSPALYERMVTRLESARALDFETLDKLLSQRLTIWHTATNMAKARPANGVGVGAFDKAYKDFATLPYDMFRDTNARAFHAHQIYVSAAAEMGIPGLLALLAAVVLVIKWYWSAPPVARERAWPYALALTVYFFPLNTQPPMFRHWSFPILLLMLAATLAALEPEETGVRSGSTVSVE